MFFKFYQFLEAYATWGATQWLMLIALVVMVGLLLRFSTTTLRFILAPLVAMEAFLLTPMFACKGSAYMFDRVSGTQSACSSSEYANYVAGNFGLGHWYMILTYAVVLGFMTYNFWRGMAHDMGWKGYVTAGQRKALADNRAAEEVAMERIREIDSIRRIGK